MPARQNLAFGQKGRTVFADVDKRRSERTDKAVHPAEMDAAHLAAVASFDKQLDRDPVVEQRRPPFARAGDDQQFAGQGGR